MKRVALILISTLTFIPLFAHASGRAAAMNVATGLTISKNGVEAVYQTAAKEKGLALLIDQTVGAGWNGNLDVIGQYRLPAGARYENSGLDRNRLPFRHPSTAKGGEVIIRLRSNVTGMIIDLKDVCLNPTQVRLANVPRLGEEVETTWNFQEVTVQLSIDFHPELTATANATTGPINIVFNNVTAAPSLMNMNSGPQFCMVRDSRGLMSVGYTVGGGSSIKIFNNVTATGGAGGAGGNVGNITNNNSNSSNNVIGNTNVINTGSGSAAGSTAGSGTSNSSAGGKPPG